MSGPTGEAVINSTANRNLSDWRVGSATGTLTISRASDIDGPQGIDTAVDVRDRQSSGKWGMVLAALREPAAFFRRGQTYRMRAYVRDLSATGRSIGITIANANYAHRPSTEARYAGYRDSGWHLLERTFVATGRAHADSALYFDVPDHGALHWQITGASVQSLPFPTPPVSTAGPSAVLEFDGQAGTPPDSRVWRYGLGGHGWGNDEQQTYTDDADNSRLDGRGNLVLTARRETVTGADGVRRNYTSARLETAGKYAVEPGSYIEATMRVPDGAGLRPAFWLIGANFRHVGWPACGELDVMETSRDGSDVVRQTIHFPRSIDSTTDAPYGDYAPGGHSRLTTPRDAEFHRYGVYFDKRVVQFYIDGRPTLGLSRQMATDRGRSWPFAQPQNLVLNIAVAGRPPSRLFPATMEVSQIAIWRDGVPMARDR